MLPKEHPHEVGARIREESGDHRQQDQISAALHPLEQHQRGQERRDHDPAEHTHQQILQGDRAAAVKAADGPQKKSGHQQQGQGSQGPVPPPQPEGQGDQAGRRRRVDIHSIVVGHLGGPQQLKGRPRGDACQQYREKDGRQKEQDNKKQRGQYYSREDARHHFSNTSKSPGPALIAGDGPQQLCFAEIRPQHIRKVELRIGGLPQQEIG